MRIAEVKVVLFVRRAQECELAMRRPVETCKFVTSKKGPKKSIAFSYTVAQHSARISPLVHPVQVGRHFNNLHSPQLRQWGNQSTNANRTVAR